MGRERPELLSVSVRRTQKTEKATENGNRPEIGFGILTHFLEFSFTSEPSKNIPRRVNLARGPSKQAPEKCLRRISEKGPSSEQYGNSQQAHADSIEKQEHAYTTHQDLRKQKAHRCSDIAHLLSFQLPRCEQWRPIDNSIGTWNIWDSPIDRRVKSRSFSAW